MSSKNPNASVRPVPKTSRYWWREYEGIWRTMDGLPVLTDDFGSRWVYKMRIHYAERLRTMYRQRPTNIRLDALREIPTVTADGDRLTGCGPRR